MTDIQYRNSIDTNLVQSGAPTQENRTALHPGFYETVSTPRTCPCCFKDHFYDGGFGQVLGRNGFEPHVCAYADHWIEDEWQQVTCPDHKVEKMKDGLFGCLPGSFKTPAGLTVYKKPVEGAVAPIVHSRKRRGKR